MTTFKDKAEFHRQMMAEFIMPWLKERFAPNKIEQLKRGGGIQAQLTPSVRVTYENGGGSNLFCRIAEQRYSAFFFEMKRTTNPDTPGWMSYAESSHWLVYSFYREKKDALEIFIMDFRAVRKWFWDDGNYKRYKLAPIGEGKPGSAIGYLVKLGDIALELGLQRTLVARGGKEIERIEPYYPPGKKPSPQLSLLDPPDATDPEVTQP